MDKLTKQGYFIVYIEEISVEDIVQIYIKEVFIKYKALDKCYGASGKRWIVVDVMVDAVT